MEGQQSGERAEERAGERAAETSGEGASERVSEGASERAGEGTGEPSSEGVGRRTSETSCGGGMVRGHSAIMKDPEDVDTAGGAPGSHGVSFGETIRGLAAQGHGLGEAFRGNVGAALDSMAGNAESKARYEEIARRGRYEMREKKFAPKDEDDKR